ncbi:1,4-dihydroxy-2-naphthoate prenyltransferase, partial [Streptococcus suis]
PDLLLTIQVSCKCMTLQFSWPKIIEIIFMSIPLLTLIANIMLANNTRDLEEDIRNHRYTLDYYIGNKNSLKLYFVLASLP